ncbi:MAG: MATE family efflux transporter [Oscillospiraceae bacterium]|nr:MATE family efflux transporter [Oscillospiraceae bacterium]
MAEPAKKTHDFSQGSVAKTILRLALPLTAAQIITILYNLVDRMYLGRLADVGRLALTGVGITMPIISIIAGFANLCSFGGSPLASIERGRGDNKKAERIMGNAFAMLIIIGILLMSLCFIFKRPMLYLFGASDATYQYASDYLNIYISGTLLVMISLGMNPFINMQGFGGIGMVTGIVGAVVNIILDPIFIFVLGMGVKGAALATIIAQGCSAVWVLLFLTGKKAILKLRLENFRLDFRIVSRIISLGVSGLIISLTNSLVQIVCNKTLQITGGDIYVSVMTVLSSVRELSFSAINGITNGATPVISYNYGAGNYGRICKAIKFVSFAAFLCSSIIWATIMIVPDFFIRIFNSDSELIRVGVPAFRIYFAAYCLMWCQLAGQTVAQALGKAKTAVFFSLLRKAFLVTPLSLILPHLFGLGVNGVFIAEPLSILFGSTTCFITMIITVYRPMKKRALLEQAGR